MFEHRIEEKEKFYLLGKKAETPLTNHEEIGNFFENAHSSGLIDNLMKLMGSERGKVTNTAFVGAAQFIGDLKDGNFNYYLACEVPKSNLTNEYTTIEVKKSAWAIFKADSVSLDTISKMEMYVYMNWLPTCEYNVINDVQMNAFLNDGNGEYTELWIPVEKKSI